MSSRVPVPRAPLLHRLLAAAFLVGLLGAAGCGRREATPAESGAPVTLAQGQVFRFVDHFRGGAVPEGIRRSADGLRRIAIRSAHQPVLCAPAPYVFRQKLRAPAGAQLRTAFGIVPSASRTGPGVRFTATLRRDGKSTELLSAVLTGRQTPDAPNWTPVAVSLPEGEIELELATELVGDTKGGELRVPAAARALWVNPTVSAPATGSRPNIVLVLLDDLRADHIGCYGYSRDTSPFIDGLASHGVLFSDATSPATSTFPSTRGILTSSYQFVRAIPRPKGASSTGDDNAPLRQTAAWPASLQGELRRGGYEALACVGGGYLDPALGFDAGFDWYWAPTETPMLPDQLTVVKQRLQGRGRDPFFLLLHTYEVHHYRRAWRHGLDRFDHGYNGRLTDPDQLREALYADPKDFPSADLRYLRDLYDGEIWHTDRHLRTFFDWLLAQEWATNTIIVIAADHGEAFGEHGVLRHGGTPYREVTHVPLICYRPDGQWRARKVKQPVSLIDLTPTLLELAGVSKPEAMVGSSLVPLIEGGASQARPIFAGSQTGWTARKDPWWYVSEPGDRSEELYHMGRDPGQKRNLAATSPRELAEMRDLLARFAMQAADGCRLVVTGPRREPLTIELESSAGFAYVDGPLGRPEGPVSIGVAAPSVARPPGKSGSGAVQRVQLRLPAGSDPQVVRFDTVEEGAAISVTARIGATPVSAARFHLGRSGGPASGIPVVIAAGTRAALVSDRPPVPPDVKDWGIWVWLPPSAAGTPSRKTDQKALPENVKEQLKSLGYIR